MQKGYIWYQIVNIIISIKKIIAWTWTRVLEDRTDRPPSLPLNYPDIRTLLLFFYQIILSWHISIIKPSKLVKYFEKIDPYNINNTTLLLTSSTSRGNCRWILLNCNIWLLLPVKIWHHVVARQIPQRSVRTSPTFFHCQHDPP